MPDSASPPNSYPAAGAGDDVPHYWDSGDEKGGDMIGPYRLLEKLGEGGFGIVWRAEQTHPLRREVALKLLKRGMDSRQILARFDLERRVLSAMEHPCIATMLDAGISFDGRPYFVMEMLRGKAITIYCETNALLLEEKIAMFRDVCGAVQHAHQKGVIHRDLKPSNIIVTRVDGRIVPKIIDFGIAKAVGSGGISAMTLATQDHLVLGTPQYMSPEQIEDGSNVDTRSDIYALGALLYELLTGTPPFDPRTLQVKSVPELHRIIREQPPKRPSTSFTTRQVTTPAHQGKPDASRLPDDLDWITLRALEKEPQRRYQSAAEFAADLQRFLNQEPVLAHPPSTSYIVSRLIKRHRVAFAAACVSLLAVVNGAGIAIWQAKLAHAAQVRAESETARSRETSEFLTAMLSEVADEVQKGRNPEALRLALISSQKRIECMSQDRDLQIRLITQVVGLFTDMSDWKLAISALKRRAEMIAARHGPHSAEARAATFKHLHVVIDMGNRIEGVRLLTEVCKDVEQHEGFGSPPWFEAQRLLVRAWIKLRNGTEALAVSSVASIEARRQLLDPDLMHEVLMYHADALEAARRYDDAIAIVDECRLIDTAGAHREGIDQKHVEILLNRHDVARAADMQKAVVDRLRTSSKSSGIGYLFQLRRLAQIELRAKRHAAASAHLDEALAYVEKLRAAADGKDTGTAASWRADRVMLLEIRIELCKAQKQPAAALASAREALITARKSGNHSLHSRALTAMADAHEFAGHLDDAWQVHQELYELHSSHNASAKNRLDNLREMSRLRLCQDRPQDAFKHAHDAWLQAMAEPTAQLEPDYLAYMAALAMRTWKALHNADPSHPAPIELAIWSETIRKDPSAGQ